MSQKCKQAEVMEHSWLAHLAAAFQRASVHWLRWLGPSLGFGSMVWCGKGALGANVSEMSKTLRNVCLQLSWWSWLVGRWSQWTWAHIFTKTGIWARHQTKYLCHLVLCFFNSDLSLSNGAWIAGLLQEILPGPIGPNKPNLYVLL